MSLPVAPSLSEETTFGLFRLVAQGRISVDAAAQEMARREAYAARRRTIGLWVVTAWVAVAFIARQLW